MGTELGLPSFHVDGGAQALLPAWLDKAVARDDLDIDVLSSDVVPTSPIPAGDSDGNCDVDGPMGSASSASPAASTCHIPGSDEEIDGVKGDALSPVSIASTKIAGAALDADQENLALDADQEDLDFC